MESKSSYPICRLNNNIIQILKKIVSSDIMGNINTGLENEIRMIDDGEHLTTIACVCPNPLNGHSKVTLSTAYCQFFWLIVDVAMKISDRCIIEESCSEFGISLNDFMQQSEIIRKMPKDLLQMKLNISGGIKADQFIDYFNSIHEILDSSFWEQMESEYSHAKSILEKSSVIDFKAINNYDLNTKYHERVNSIYCYGIAFILLHELSHHSLGHVLKQNINRVEDEGVADMSAFWSIYNDIIGEERFSANAAIMFVFFSFMELDPSLKEDGIHPREDKRLFAIYDLIKDENKKYTDLLVRLLDFWAINNNVAGFPVNLPCTTDSVNKIRAFFEKYNK